MDFRKSDVLDDITYRYISSFELIENKRSTMGDDAYFTLRNQYSEILKDDTKEFISSNKEYSTFRKKERKHDLKIALLDFHEIDEEEYRALSFFKRWKYRRKRRKYYREMDKFWYIVQNYRPYIPHGEYIYEEEEEEPKAVILEQPELGNKAIPEPVEPEEVATSDDVSAEATTPTEPDTTAPAGDTPLSAKNTDDGEPTKKEENADALSDFFGETENVEE